ncbi:MAG: NRDE family protein [Planctomycetaceae bacterium]|nr:NRDE family protein [Planctomycetaceae bacterium]
MGIIAVQFHATNDSPLLIAANREERISRPTQVPRIQSGRPRVVCGIDKTSGGTWAGVNQHGLFVAVVNCFKRNLPEEPRSRGTLCRELLASRNAEEALEKAYSELLTGMYSGGNFLCVDRFSGGVAYGGNTVEVEKLRPGLHILSANRLNDYNDHRQEFARRLLTLQRVDSAVTFFAVAGRTFSRKPDTTGKHGIEISEPDYGTVSSMLLSLTDKSQRSIMQYAAGPPSEKNYEDISALLRQVLSTEKANRAAAAAKIAEATPKE